mgnify:CR=1 FL=1
MMIRSIHRIVIAAIFGLLLTIVNPSMAVLVDATATFSQLSLASSRVITPANLGGFDPTGSGKLVVTVSSEKNGSGLASITGITYNSVALTEAVQFFSSVSNQLTGIFFLDNPIASGNLQINYSSNQNGIGVSVLALSEIAPGVALTSGNDGQSTSLTTLLDNMFVVASHVNNGNSGCLLYTSPSPRD